MKEYIKPILEILEYNAEDIVTTSGFNETENENDNIIFDEGGW